MSTLYDYYNSQGKSLPKPQDRFSDTSFADAAKKAGVDPTGYTGTAEQNTAISQHLGGGIVTPPEPMVSSKPVRTEVNKNLGAYDRAIASLGQLTKGTEKPVDIEKETKDQFSAADAEYNKFSQQLNDIGTRSSAAMKNLISGISSDYASRKAEEVDSNDRYMKGLQLLGIQTGTAQYLPYQQAGTLRQAEIEGHKQLGKLDAEERSALAEAEKARNDEDYKLLNDKMNLYKDLQERKRTIVSDLYTQSKNRQDLQKGEIELAGQYAPALYEEYDKLPDDQKELYIIEAAKQLKVSPMSLVNAMATEKERLQDRALETANTLSLINDRNGGSGGGSGGLGAGADDFAATLETVANMETTVTGKKTVLSNLQNYIKSGDFKSAYNQIANSVENGLVGESKQRFANARTDYNVMLGLKDAIKKYTDAGGKTSFLKGSADKIARNLGTLANDPQFGALATELQREFQTYRNTMTGAAFGAKESREYAAVNPTAGKNLDLNLATIDGALAQLQNRYQGTINSRVPGAQYILDYANGATKNGGGTDNTSTAQQVIESKGYDYQGIKEAYPDLSDEEIIQQLNEQ